MVPRASTAARRATSGVAVGLRPDAWPWLSELSTALAVAAFAAYYVVVDHVLGFFVPQCTSVEGLCTPLIRCGCSHPQQKHQTVTQDGNACFRCVEAFCPAVPEGNTSCYPWSCECQDTSFRKRVVAQDDEPPCWQCVHPVTDFTLRRSGGAAPAGCLADASSRPLGRGRRQGVSRVRRLRKATSASECIPFRYNGVTIVDKRRSGTCLAWAPSGVSWHLASCDRAERAEVAQSKFKKYTATDGAGADLFCTGKYKNESCVELAEYICTTSTSQCSHGPCRCEHPTWVRQGMESLDDPTCFNCVPPSAACPIAFNKCMASPCECQDPAHVKVQFVNASDVAVGVAPCYRCQHPQYGLSMVFVIYILAFFGLFGFALGLPFVRLRPLAAAAERVRARWRQRGLAWRSWADHHKARFGWITKCLRRIVVHVVGAHGRALRALLRWTKVARRREVAKAPQAVQAVAVAPRGGRAAASAAVDTECVVCLAVEREFAFLPCGHRCVCGACAAKVRTRNTPRCPVCRAAVRNACRIFL